MQRDWSSSSQIDPTGSSDLACRNCAFTGLSSSLSKSSSPSSAYLGLNLYDLIDNIEPLGVSRDPKLDVTEFDVTQRMG